MNKTILFLTVCVSLSPLAYAEHLDTAIVWERADGGVSVTYVDDRDRLPGETDEQLIDRMAALNAQAPLLAGATKSKIKKTDIPPHDSPDRDCWSLKGNKVEVDSTKLAAKQAKAQAKSAVLLKLKISEEELALLQGA